MKTFIETIFGFAIMGGLLGIILLNVWYQKEKRKQYKEYEDLRKMMPKLPKEEKRDNKR